MALFGKGDFMNRHFKEVKTLGQMAPEESGQRDCGSMVPKAGSLAVPSVVGTVSLIQSEPSEDTETQPEAHSQDCLEKITSMFSFLPFSGTTQL